MALALLALKIRADAAVEAHQGNMACIEMGGGPLPKMMQERRRTTSRLPNIITPLPQERNARKRTKAGHSADIVPASDSLYFDFDSEHKEEDAATQPISPSRRDCKLAIEQLEMQLSPVHQRTAAVESPLPHRASPSHSPPPRRSPLPPDARRSPPPSDTVRRSPRQTEPRRGTMPVEAARTAPQRLAHAEKTPAVMARVRGHAESNTAACTTCTASTACAASATPGRAGGSGACGAAACSAAAEGPTAHAARLFRFEKQYTFGLLNFDDELVSAMLHVDQEARLRPSLIVQYGMNQLGARDVYRADLLSRIQPLAPEEAIAREMEMAEWQQRKAQQPAGATDAAATLPPSKETLILLSELEQAGVLERLGDRSQRLRSNPSLIKRHAHCVGADEFAPLAARARNKASDLVRQAIKQRRLSSVQAAALRTLAGLHSASASELGRLGRRGSTLMCDTSASDSRRRAHSPTPDGGGGGGGGGNSGKGGNGGNGGNSGGGGSLLPPLVAAAPPPAGAASAEFRRGSSVGLALRRSSSVGAALGGGSGGAAAAHIDESPTVSRSCQRARRSLRAATQAAAISVAASGRSSPTAPLRCVSSCGGALPAAQAVAARCDAEPVESS